MLADCHRWRPSSIHLARICYRQYRQPQTGANLGNKSLKFTLDYINRNDKLCNSKHSCSMRGTKARWAFFDNATGSAPPLIKTFKYFWLCTGDNNKIELLCKQMNTLILLYKQTKVIFTEFSLYLVKHWVFSSPTSHYITNLSRSNGWKLIGQTRPTAGLLPPYCRPSKKRG